MATPRVIVLRAPGTNCDQETAYAFQQSGAEVDSIHVNRFLDQSRSVQDYQILCLPGGFSYGDDVAAGRILANQLRSHLQDTLHEFVSQDKLVLGICNGFQILIKSGLLLADSEQGPPATLTWNDSGKFEDRWVHLQASGNKSVFLRDVEQLYLPVAHAEGKFVIRSQEIQNSLEQNDQLVLRYASGNGTPIVYPENPNGSDLDVAGVCDSTGRVFGLMPHPERYIHKTQHPRWTRGGLPDEGDGMKIFRNAVSFFE